MKKGIRFTCVLVMCAFLMQGLASTTVGDADKPEWEVGDTWEYKSSQLGMTTNVTLEVTMSTTININGTNYEVYDVDVTTEISMYGFNLITTGHNYNLISDFAIVKEETSQTILIVGSTYDPPKKELDFPMEVGNTWTSTFTESSYIIMNNDIISYDNQTKTVDYRVMEMGVITVEAGTFQCYLIQADEGEGTITKLWYSPEVKNIVKESSETYGMVTKETELTSYDVVSPSGNGGSLSGDKEGFFLFEMPYLLLLILIPIIIVVLILGIVVSRKKKKAIQAAAPIPTWDATAPTAQTPGAPVYRPIPSHPPQYTAPAPITTTPPRPPTYTTAQPRPVQPHQYTAPAPQPHMAPAAQPTAPTAPIPTPAKPSAPAPATSIPIWDVTEPTEQTPAAQPTAPAAPIPTPVKPSAPVPGAPAAPPTAPAAPIPTPAKPSAPAPETPAQAPAAQPAAPAAPTPTPVKHSESPMEAPAKTPDLEPSVPTPPTPTPSKSYESPFEAALKKAKTKEKEKEKPEEKE